MSGPADFLDAGRQAAMEQELEALVDIDRTLTLSVLVKAVREAAREDEVYGSAEDVVFGTPRIEGRWYIVPVGLRSVPGAWNEVATAYPFTHAEQRLQDVNGQPAGGRVDELDPALTAELKAGRLMDGPHDTTTSGGLP